MWSHCEQKHVSQYGCRILLFAKSLLRLLFSAVNFYFSGKLLSAANSSILVPFQGQTVSFSGKLLISAANLIYGGGFVGTYK
jgi:hypothetical protein